MSASALSKGQRLCSENIVEVEGHTEPAHTGFSTAGGSKITVSGGAMSRVKHLFTDMMDEGGASPLEVQPTGVCGSMVDSAKDLVLAAADNRSGQEGVLGDCVRSEPEGMEGQGQCGEPSTDTNLEGVVDAKDTFLGNPMDTSLSGSQDVEVDLEGFDLENFAAFTQLPQQNAGRETTDAVVLDGSTAANLPAAADRHSEFEESHKAIDDTLIAEVAGFALGDHGEEEKRNVSTSSTVSLEGSSVYELPYLDTQMVQQMLESTAMSNAGSDDPTDGKDVAEDGASFNLTVSLANLGEGFSRLGPNDSVTDEGAVFTCSSPHPGIKVLEEAKEAEGTESMNLQLLEHEQFFSLTQFDMSLSVPAIAEGMHDSTTQRHEHAQGRAAVDGGGGAAEEDQEAMREEEGVMMVNVRGGVVTEEGGRMTVDEKEVTMMEEREDAALDIKGRVMKEGGVLMEEKGIEMMELEGEAVIEEEEVTMEGEGITANEVRGRCAEVSQLAEDMCPTMAQKDAFVSHAVEHPTTALSFPGLQTASGKEVTVSRAALDKVRSIMRPTTLLPHDASCTKESPGAAEDEHFKESNSSWTSPKLRGKAMFVGLQTASGKCVPISKEAMEHASAQHCKPRGGEDGEGAAGTRQPTRNFRGLQTASGKAVTVSETALKAVRSLAHEPHASTGVVSSMEQEGSCHISHTERQTNHFVELQTASGKKVEVAEESLEHVRSGNGGGSSSTAHRGFTTAGGKVVDISEDALHHVKSSLGGTSGGPGLPFLQTAGGIPVAVAEESLAHVRAGRGAVEMEGNSLQQATCGLRMGTKKDRQVEVATEPLQKMQAVLMGSSGSSVRECERYDQVPPTLPLGSGTWTDAESVQWKKVTQGVPPSSAKNKSQPHHPVSVCMWPPGGGLGLCAMHQFLSTGLYTMGVGVVCCFSLHCIVLSLTLKHTVYALSAYAVCMSYAVQATGTGTGSALSSVREGGAPSVVKYAPQFKPQASAGSKNTMPKKMVEENRGTLAPATFQSMLHCLCLVTIAVHRVCMCSSVCLSVCLSDAGPQTASFKPSYHSTPEGTE